MSFSSSTAARLEPPGPESERAPEGAESGAPTDAPSRVARYLLTREVGRGAMGVVHLGVDPTLARRIALKLLQRRSRDDAAAVDTTAIHRHRLAVEARMLARVDHPNIVAVYDVGVHDERLYLAMEYIDGCPLDDHVERLDSPAPQDWRPIAELMLQCARGLAQAHAQGVTHRDFKPQNVMVDRQGVAKVLDFGLAFMPSPRLEVGESSDARASSVSRSARNRSAPSESPATGDDGWIVGTPAYMAPEQAAAGEVSSAADQFAYCVTFYQLLFGVRPFRGRSYHQRLLQITRGELAPPQRSRATPRWLRELIVRGLALEPSQRFESMDRIVQTLERRLRRTPGKRIWVIAGVLWGTLGVAWSTRPAHGLGPVCDDGTPAMRVTWNRARRAALHDAFVAANSARGAQSWARVDAIVDERLRMWSSASRDNCRQFDTGSALEAEFDRRRDCLQHALAGVDMLLREFERHAAATLDHSVAAAHAISDPRGCLSLDELTWMPRPRDARAMSRYRELRDRSARFEALVDTGQWKRAQSFGLALLEELGDPDEPDVPDLRLSVLSALGDLRHDGDMLHEALRTALRVRHRREAAKLATMLMYRGLEGDRSSAAVSAREAYARASIARAGTPPGVLAMYHRQRAIRAIQSGSIDDALAGFRLAVELRGHERDRDPVAEATAMSNLGIAHGFAQRFDDAHRWLSRAYERRVRLLGEHHPSMHFAGENLANALHAIGKFRRSIGLMERVADNCTLNFGTDAAKCLRVRAMVVDTMVQVGDYAEVQRKLAHLPAERLVTPVYLDAWLNTAGPQELARVLASIEDNETQQERVDAKLAILVALGRHAEAAAWSKRHADRDELSRLEGFTALQLRHARSLMTLREQVDRATLVSSTRLGPARVPGQPEGNPIEKVLGLRIEARRMALLGDAERRSIATIREARAIVDTQLGRSHAAAIPLLLDEAEMAAMAGDRSVRRGALKDAQRRLDSRDGSACAACRARFRTLADGR